MFTVLTRTHPWCVSRMCENLIFQIGSESPYSNHKIHKKLNWKKDIWTHKLNIIHPTKKKPKKTERWASVNTFLTKNRVNRAHSYWPVCERICRRESGSIKTETLCLKRAALKCNRVLIVGNMKKSWWLLMSYTVLGGELRDLIAVKNFLLMIKSRYFVTLIQT